MKKIIVFLFPLLAFAGVEDTHFKGSKQFIKVDLENHHGVVYVKLAGCTKSNAKITVCRDLAIIEKSEFWKMRACAMTYSTVGLISTGLSFGVAVIGGAASDGLLLAPGLAAMGLSAKMTGRGMSMSQVFTKENENDEDIELDCNYGFGEVMSAIENNLEESLLSCDVDGHTLPVDSRYYILK